MSEQLFLKKFPSSFARLLNTSNTKKKLEARFSNAKTVKQTRSFYCYKRVDTKKIECKTFSDDRNSIVQQIIP